MKRRLTIRHAVAALAWLGLLLAPLATPAAAMPVPMEVVAANIEGPPADMPEAMPCCPDEPANPDCAKVCPLMATCAGMAFPTMSGATVLSAPMALLAVITPDDDAMLSGLAEGPPARPPKA